MSIIEGTLGPLTQATGTSPVEGTTEIQTLTIDASGGTFALEFRGKVTEDIAWNATNNTLIANILTGLTGVKCVQTLTFTSGWAGGDHFKLRFRGQETAAIAWSATNNTLRDNIDAALEALGNIGTAGVVTTVGTMTNGIGTITVAFAVRGLQPAIQVSEQRIAGGGSHVSCAITTAGIDGPFEDSGVSVAADSMTSGVGTASITFSGESYEKRAIPDLITVADNSLAGAGTLTVTEGTPGVDAFGRGLLPGGTVADTSDGSLYVNEGTATAPDYKAVTTS